MNTQVQAEMMVKLDRITFWDRFISVVLWLVAMVWMVPTMLFLTLLWTFFDVQKVDWLTRIQCAVQVLLTGCKYRTVVHPKVDPDTPYVFMQNHTNHFDYAVAYPATPHCLQGIELEKHFKYPIYGWFMKTRGTIPVRPGSQGQSPKIMAHIQSEINKGRSILAFPEGNPHPRWASSKIS